MTIKRPTPSPSTPSDLDGWRNVDGDVFEEKDGEINVRVPTPAHLPPRNARRIFVGIDPGASGGMSVLVGDRVESVAMPATERDAWDWLSRWGEPFHEGRPFAMIEKVGGYVGEAQPGSAAFKFGYNAGMLNGFLVASGIPYEQVTPQRWQKGLGIPSRRKGEGRTEWKNRLKQHALRLFPRSGATLKTCDSLLIAEWCRRSGEGTLKK